jgi:hypothetical protein
MEWSVWTMFSGRDRTVVQTEGSSVPRAVGQDFVVEGDKRIE